MAECGPCVAGVVGVCGDVADVALDDDFAGFDGGGGGGGNFVAHDYDRWDAGDAEMDYWIGPDLSPDLSWFVASSLFIALACWRC